MNFLNLKEKFLSKKENFFGLIVVLAISIPFFVFAQEGLGIVPDCGEGQICTFCDLVILINSIINYIVYTLAVPLATVMFMYAGFLYLTDMGSGKNLVKAKGVFQNVAIGLFFILAAFLIVDMIIAFLVNDTVENALRGDLSCQEGEVFQDVEYQDDYFPIEEPYYDEPLNDFQPSNGGDIAPTGGFSQPDIPAETPTSQNPTPEPALPKGCYKTVGECLKNISGRGTCSAGGGGSWCVSR